MNFKYEKSSISAGVMYAHFHEFIHTISETDIDPNEGVRLFFSKSYPPEYEEMLSNIINEAMESLEATQEEVWGLLYAMFFEYFPKYIERCEKRCHELGAPDHIMETYQATLLYLADLEKQHQPMLEYKSLK